MMFCDVKLERGHLVTPGALKDETRLQNKGLKAKARGYV